MKFEVRSGENSLTRLIAGIILILSFFLTIFHSIYWVVLSGFIGVTHITSAVFGFCPMEKILHHIFKLSIKGKD